MFLSLYVYVCIDRHNLYIGTDSIIKNNLFLLLPTSEPGFLKALCLCKTTGCSQWFFPREFLFPKVPCHWVKLKIRGWRTLPRSHEPQSLHYSPK